MRDSGRASKAAIERVIKDLTDYESVMIEELELIMKDVDQLSDIWNDKNYKLFLASVDNIKSSITSELDTIRYTRHELERKVGMM